MANGDSRSFSDLLTGLVADISHLFRKEIDLARTEVSEEFSNALSGLKVFATGLVLAIGAIGVLLAAIVKGLSAVLVAQGFTEVNAEALASAIVVAVVGLAAWLTVSRGLAAMRHSNLTLPRTTNSLRRDVGVVKERLP